MIPLPLPSLSSAQSEASIFATPRRKNGFASFLFFFCPFLAFQRRLLPMIGNMKQVKRSPFSASFFFSPLPFFFLTGRDADRDSGRRRPGDYSSSFLFSSCSRKEKPRGSPLFFFFPPSSVLDFPRRGIADLLFFPPSFFPLLRDGDLLLPRRRSRRPVSFPFFSPPLKAGHRNSSGKRFMATALSSMTPFFSCARPARLLRDGRHHLSFPSFLFLYELKMGRFVRARESFFPPQKELKRLSEKGE